MSAGFLVARDEGLYRRAVHALLSRGAVADNDELGGGVVQFTDDSGRPFTLYERVPQGMDWEVREGPFTAAPGVHLPNMQLVIACPFECRWPELLADIADTVARTAEAPTWVLDGDGVIWDAEAVDPHRVRV